MLEVVAVFVAPVYLDAGRLRIWAKTQARSLFVLLTDDPSEGNTILLRDLRCADVVTATVRTPGTQRAPAEREAAKLMRDDYMVAASARLVIFDTCAEWEARYPSKARLFIPDRSGLER